ncbi:MAG: hypothetical protein AB7D51_11515 [Desulfovibrionaceae bacterium]
MSGKFESFMAEMPRIGETDGVPFDDKEVGLHFFRGVSHWMAIKSDGHGLFYGCIVLDGDFKNAEWGCFRLRELAKMPGMMALSREKVRRFLDVVVEVIHS